MDNNDIVIGEVIDRCKQIANLRSDKEFADILGLSAADFGNRKKRGSLLPLIISWAAGENVDLNFIITARNAIAHGGDLSPDVTMLLKKTQRVLTSTHPSAPHELKSKIFELDEAINSANKIEELEKQLNQMQKKLDKANLENQRLGSEEEEQSSSRKVA